MSHESHEKQQTSPPDILVVLAQQQAVLEQVQTFLGEQQVELGRCMACFHATPADQPAGSAASTEAGGATELGKLRQENLRLQQALREKEALAQELLQRPKAAGGQVDLEAYETELNEYRRQLDADRQKLSAEIQQVRVRNEELGEATRETEMEMSRERAELGRERQRLERLREEVKSDLERLQREGGMRESLAPVQRLRDEITQRRQPAPQDGPALNDRLRSFRHRLSE